MDEETKDPNQEFKERLKDYYESLVNNSVGIMQIDDVTKCIEQLSAELKEDTVKSIIQAMLVGMTAHAYNSLGVYDTMLKVELGKQFDLVGHHVNLLKADNEGLKGLIKILQTRLDKVEKELQVYELKNQVG